MRICPELQALRSNDAPQRTAQTAMFAARDAVRRHTDWRPVLAELDHFGAGRELSECSNLADLVRIGGAGRNAATCFASAHLDALGKHPLGHPAYRHYCNPAFAQLVIAQSGNAILSLVAFEPGKRDCTAFAFGNGERHDRVLAGSAHIRLISRTGGGIQRVNCLEEQLTLGSNSQISLDCASQAMLVEDCQSRLVMLRLQRAATNPEPTREYRLSDGQLIHQAAATLKESRLEMMVRLLGAMEASQATPVIAEMTSQGSDALRWQAVRECLSLDTRIGFSVLTKLATDPADPLAAPAGALRAQLVEQFPALSELTGDPSCPA